jgi:Holliday junction DNA helicase RuvB
MPRKRHVDAGPPGRPVSGPVPVGSVEHSRPIPTSGGATARLSELRPARAAHEDALDAALRPRSFDEYIGQRRVVDNLRVFVEAARRRGEALDHVLFCGPPGLGKTTLAHLIAGALDVGLRPVGAPAIEHKGTLASYLTGLNERDVLFIDEIHRLQPVVEEYLYPAMEDFRIEIPVGDGPAAQLIHMTLPRFTLVGATTRTGLLTSPLRDRFGIVLRLDYYTPAELAEIVRRSALRLGVEISARACRTIGERARGTPRIANRLLRRVRDFAEVEADGAIDDPACGEWLSRLGVDPRGLDEMDRALLRTIITRFDGGPVGIESLAAAVSEESDTLEDVYEPYLIQEGFLSRTSRGRVAARLAYEHLGIPLRGPGPSGPPGSPGSIDPSATGGGGDQQRLF